MCSDENFKCEYVFHWIIDNFSYCWQQKDEAIESPEFTTEYIEGSKWALCIYPRGHDDVNYVSCFLKRKLNGEENLTFEIDYDLIFLDVNGSIFLDMNGSILDQVNTKRTFRKGLGWGISNLKDRNIKFMETLTVCCRLRKKCEKATQMQELFARTVIRVEQTTFDWNIKRFSNIETDKKESFSIKLSSEDSVSFDLILSGGQYRDKTVLVRIIPSLTEVKFFAIDLSIKDTKNERIECGLKEFFSNTPEDVKFLPLIFTKEKLIEMKDLYLKDDSLSLVCECAFTTGIAHEGIGRTVSGIPVEYCMDIDADKNQPRNNTEEIDTYIHNDLKSLYKDAILCDMMVRTLTRSYPAHIAVLCARSPVFKAMFTSDMKETTKRNVDILDLDDDTVSRMLLYMYTDNVEYLQWENAILLYEAADKYEIVPLRTVCASFLTKHLTHTNVCDALVLADRHEDEDFKRALQNYIKDNKRDILNLKEWELFMESNRDLATETLFKICKED
ncbi:TD and POZ domain-containing protein 3 [Nephila pilipes]|uniref:TD and POZ domain-containing protein 3 n=1 Tax=Nephila pilipes TaxID=299642 RepID=A0A8X6P539_NEPPI|nr:TD and POZ domain-containing protein 3 [Nephila pilipes]